MYARQFAYVQDAMLMVWAFPGIVTRPVPSLPLGAFLCKRTQSSCPPTHFHTGFWRANSQGLRGLRIGALRIRSLR
eukprot:3305314-Alexandrium_andersonii.AAC.1